MGYQLNCVKLWGVVTVGAVGVTPNPHCPPDPASDKSCGTAGLPAVQVLHFLLLPLPCVVVQVGATAWETAQTPAATAGSTASALFVERSAGSCSSRIAFGLIGLGEAAVGAVTPRANPSCSHSLVAATHWPEVLSTYSTRR